MDFSGKNQVKPNLHLEAMNEVVKGSKGLQLKRPKL